MIIVAGHLRVDPANRDAYLETCREVVTLGRATAGCLDFALSADLVEPDRINILERWESRETLDTFRGAGTPDDQAQQIIGADVREFTTDSEVSLTD